ncbi:efflux RND transporter periplasmic adaptor subunit [Sphingobacterium sp. UT-1RO-CII-1]|uniref:efflux RND transporter periplasmic adaptor subunit n=1 Tax=Sphingobacterium sp. UT-1RO-CII-1 TaxID=2995225 RepID=UPI00227AAFB3|nr:efflux RND transporter periplasmic adaptor subunit [Sphingobacterium sp. UT-1RO-CII-1]MCY4780449.1 efflux RND transporter periplasmic adaptor subunit [Sphingobacterium sp. UT-1RO-CII-1]
MRKYSFLALLIIVFAACQSEESTQGKQQGIDSVLTVEVSSPQEIQPVYTIKLPGQLEPNESVDVFAKVKGFVKSIHVDIGDRVSKGQLLAVMEAPEMDTQGTADLAKYQQLLANYKVSKLRYDRLKGASTAKNGAVSGLELERAYGDMLRDSAAVEEGNFSYKKTNQLRDYLVIKAPFSGVITQRNYSIGALVGDMGMPFFRLVADDVLQLKLAVPELHAQSISDTTLAHFTVLSIPDSTFKARLKRNARVIDPVSRALNLEFDVQNNDKSLNGGDYADAVLHLQRKKATLFVPFKSVVVSQSGTFVLRVNLNNEIERVAVKVGVKNEDLVEVFGGLENSDRIVLKGSEEIVEGKKVKVMSAS